jgi:Icc-related predicted phosphoesterase
MKDIVKIAAVGDTHCKKTTQGELRNLFAEINDSADILVLCGDLTDYGLPEEAQIFVKELAPVKIPIVGVLGNHDFESSKELEVKHILTDAGVTILDGEAHEILGIGFAGTKGFCGGFGRGALGPWGEQAVKSFVNEAVQEALKLESALARLRTNERIAILHYSPIKGTVEGEPIEIYPYLGTSRLEEPLLRYPVNVVVHGHAHSGSLEGTTASGTPVFNVAMPLLRKKVPEKAPFRLFDIQITKEEPVTMPSSVAV